MKILKIRKQKFNKVVIDTQRDSVDSNVANWKYYS